MDLAGEYRIPVSRDRLWQALMDPALLRPCIPGCEDFTKISDSEYSVRINARLGTIKGLFTGKVTLGALDPPAGYTIAIHLHGGPAGFGKGSAKVGLAAQGAATVLTYLGRAEVGGKLASLGSRALQAMVAKAADDFFTCFIAALTAATASPPPSAGPSAAAGAGAPAEMPAGMPAEMMDAAPPGPVPHFTAIQPIAPMAAPGPGHREAGHAAEPGQAPVEAGFRLNSATIIQGIGLVLFLIILAVLFLLR